METDWREIINMVANGQQAMTRIEAIKAIMVGMEYDHEKIEAVSAVLGIKKEVKENA